MWKGEKGWVLPALPAHPEQAESLGTAFLSGLWLTKQRKRVREIFV